MPHPGEMVGLVGTVGGATAYVRPRSRPRDRRSARFSDHAGPGWLAAKGYTGRFRGCGLVSDRDHWAVRLDRHWLAGVLDLQGVPEQQ